jgi:hypothetical protein
MGATMRGEARAISIVLLAGLLLTGTSAKAEQKWKMLEADNGAVSGIDLNSIDYFNDGKAMAITCVAENHTCSPANMTRLVFDCRGHYMDVDRGGPTTLAPPRSVVGRMAELACAGAKDTRFTSTQPTSTPPPQRPAMSASAKAFNDCLLAEGKAGSFATAGPAFEAGKSVLSLMGQCKAQWDTWQNECVGRGGPNDDLSGCASRAYHSAYEILKTLGK